MQFTPQELKLIERLRKQERMWNRTRWILLAMGVLTIGVYAYIAIWIFGALGSEELSADDQALIVAFFWPKVLFGNLLAAVLIGLAVRDWRGNAMRMLVLRLLEDHQKDSENRSN